MPHKPDEPWINKLSRLSIKVWRYRKDIDPMQRIHIGPMADQWRDIMGIGDGVTIDHIDAIGILIRAVQEANEKIEKLERQLNERQ